MTWFGWLLVGLYVWGCGKTIIDNADGKISDDKTVATIVVYLLMLTLVLLVGTGTGI